MLWILVLELFLVPDWSQPLPFQHASWSSKGARDPCTRLSGKLHKRKRDMRTAAASSLDCLALQSWVNKSTRLLFTQPDRLCHNISSQSANQIDIAYEVLGLDWITLGY